MSHKLRLILVLGVLLPIGGSPAQTEDSKGLPQRNQVEVRFIDGSTVRMELLQEDLEVITKYGKLTVPAGDIRHIEFGLHLSDFTVKKVQDLIARLGSKAHAEREGASKDLVLLGYEAFPAHPRLRLTADLWLNRTVRATDRSSQRLFSLGLSSTLAPLTNRPLVLHQRKVY